ncbi:DNA repair protein, putative [Hondaea fermentalgiana]|uniref:DNA repair protein, putative n=1 Tax=Hondaea fermentalgiana TaxID=2315210 RepID=A0A2R5GB22_9STRA|nr:DNA repair protein, putative [Hondaea fermentalgiana]|eukprot:GBG28207.1 DNA repair protein, putative [Hondaea fermentalgiana]
MRKSGAPSVAKKRALEEGRDSGASDNGLSQDASRRFNEKAMQDGDVVVHRAPVLRFLAVPQSVLARPFRPPLPKGWRMPASEVGLGQRNVGRKSLGVRRMKPIQLGAPSAKYKPLRLAGDDGSDSGSGSFQDVKDELFEKYEKDPVVLYESPTDDHKVIVEPVVGKFLREHQREGIQFLFECIAGLREFDGCGCILADDMGLGKTLQSITLLYTALRQGLEKEKPLARRVIVVTPTSLVRNWDNEIEKWLKGRVRTLALAESSKSENEKRIRAFTDTRQYDVLVISYDTFRLNASSFKSETACDLLICDEAHRLKNDQTQTSKALDLLHTRRRVLLSGTPMQNDLEEFYAMVNFCNPRVLGTVSQFRKKFQNPILTGREPDASDEEVRLSEARSQELSDIVNLFILRRTNSLLSKHLPPKLTQVVCVYMTDMQKRMYNHMIFSKVSQYEETKAAKAAAEAAGDGAAASVPKIPAQALASINAMKKLCNHPQLLYQPSSMYKEQRARTKKVGYGLEDINQFFPPGFGASSGGSRRGGRGASAVESAGYSSKHSNCEWSGKFLLCQRLLQRLRNETDDRMVIVSNYTQTLDLFSMLCSENDFPFVRLDGGSSAKRRQAMVDRLNDPTDDVFVFLLSSRAGGCGLNLIGANRLILFDPDWNPATDKQAAARVWRDGQKKRCYVYRFLATGTIEEKVFQRQLSKEGLQSVVAEEQSLESAISVTELKDLFTLREDTVSDTHDKYKCTRCDPARLASQTLKVDLDRAAKIDAEDAKKSAAASSDRPTAGSPTAAGASKRRPLVRRMKRACISGKGEAHNPPPAVPPDAVQISLPNEGDLLEWSHHITSDSVDDVILRKAGAGLVSFVFGQAIDGESLARKAALDAEKKAAEESCNKSDVTTEDADTKGTPTKASPPRKTRNERPQSESENEEAPEDDDDNDKEENEDSEDDDDNDKEDNEDSEDDDGEDDHGNSEAEEDDDANDAGRGKFADKASSASDVVEIDLEDSDEENDDGDTANKRRQNLATVQNLM